MAYTVSNNFKTNIKDGTIQKSCLVLFDDCFFSTEDFTDKGVTFNQFFNTSDDLTFGDCPSDTLSFEVFSHGALSGYQFGTARAYLGVQTTEWEYSFGDAFAHIEVDGEIFTASELGLYHNDERIDYGSYVSLVSDGVYVYAVGEREACRVKMTDFTVEAYIPHRYMAQKLKTPTSAVFEGNTVHLWDGTVCKVYEYVPMGVYEILKPRSTVGETVSIQDAHDYMMRFDVDASEFLSGLTYPKTIGQIYTELCSYIGVSYASATFEGSTTSYASSPFPDNSFKCRDILSWIAERAYCVAHFNRDGVLELRWLGEEAEVVEPTDISMQGYLISEFRTAEVTGVLLKSTDGTSLSFGSMENPYPIMGNPFVNTITSLAPYEAIPTYTPMEFRIIECDPSVDVGDLFGLKPLDDYVLLTDTFGSVYGQPVGDPVFRLFANPDGQLIVNSNDIAIGRFVQEYEALFDVNDPQIVPLLSRTVTFNGGISARYEIVGNEKRDLGDADFQYNASIGVSSSKAQEVADSAVTDYDASLNQREVFRKLTNNEEDQGIYLLDGKIYINAEYIQAGTLSANYISGGTLSGVRVEAQTGLIGGFNINATSLYTSDEYYYDTPTHTQRYRFSKIIKPTSWTGVFMESWEGDATDTYHNTVFKLTQSGDLYVADISSLSIKAGTTYRNELTATSLIGYDSSSNLRYRLQGLTGNTDPQLNLYDRSVANALRMSLNLDNLTFTNTSAVALGTFNTGGSTFRDASNNTTAIYAKDGHYFFDRKLTHPNSGSSAAGFFEIGYIRLWGSYQSEPLWFFASGRSFFAMCFVQFNNSSTINGHSVANVKAYGSSNNQRLGIAFNRNGSNFKEFTVVVENKQTYNQVMIDEVHIGGYSNITFEWVNTYQNLDIALLSPTFATWV